MKTAILELYLSLAMFPIRLLGNLVSVMVANAKSGEVSLYKSISSGTIAPGANLQEAEKAYYVGSIDE